MTTEVYEGHGIRFRYPSDWELEISDDGPRTTVAVQAPGGLAFSMVTVDETCPEPTDLADEALEAMRTEYPELDSEPTQETIAGHGAIGHDLEFFSLDIVNSCTIRCFRSAEHTVLVFSQWSDMAESDPAPETLLRAIRRSLEETDD